MRGQSWHNTQPHSRLPLSCLCMDDLTTERIFDSQSTWVIDVLGYFLTLSMGVCITRHWQTSGRLVQELNVSTVYFETCPFFCDHFCSLKALSLFFYNNKGPLFYTNFMVLNGL